MKACTKWAAKSRSECFLKEKVLPFLHVCYCNLALNAPMSLYSVIVKLKTRVDLLQHLCIFITLSKTIRFVF